MTRPPVEAQLFRGPSHVRPDSPRSTITWMVCWWGLLVVPVGQNEDGEHHAQGEQDGDHRDKWLHPEQVPLSVRTSPRGRLMDVRCRFGKRCAPDTVRRVGAPQTCDEVLLLASQLDLVVPRSASRPSTEMARTAVATSYRRQQDESGAADDRDGLPVVA